MTWDIIGQEQAVAVLRRAVEDEARLSHAYLFVGPEHVGRATTARRFAQALNCDQSRRRGFPASPPDRAEPGKARLQDDEEPGAHADAPCLHCRSCRLIGEDKHPDVEWLGVGGVCDETEHRDHGADGSRDIRICQVRRLERVVSRTAFEARYRVVIVDPADALTTEAANAFLKTLEEPAPNVVLVLITAREEALRETVRSRCRRIAFSGVPREAIEAALQQRWGAEPEQAARLARLVQGRLGWAVAALQDERLLIDRERTIDDIESLLAGGFNERFAYAAALGARFPRDPQTVRTSLDVWGDWWRDVLLTAAGREELTAAAERLDTLRSHAAQYGIAGAVQALTAITNVRRHLEEHASPTLALEVMLLELPIGAGRSGP
jgi:DNA polymerase-3 subunit delta'